MPRAKPKARADLAVVELDGEAVIYDERSGSLHHLNPTATIVFSMCGGSATIRELSVDIAEAFDVSLDTVEPEVRRVLRQFRKAELLDGNGKAHG
jgi:PqqD family protein of HPr-rel-A system